MLNSAASRFGKAFQSPLSFGFALILSAHIFLGALYAFTIPMGEAYDEHGHYAYIRYLVNERQIPQVSLEESLLTPEEDLQFSQPPLYYLLSALATFWIPAQQELPLEENPHLFVGGLNRFVHPPRESEIYRQEFLALLGGRFVSILLSTIVVAATYFLARILFPERKDIILGATAVTSFSPMFVFMSSVVNNDAAVTAFSSLFILSAVQAILRPALKHWLGMGLFLGLAILSKYNALALFPIAALVLVVGIFQRSGLSRRNLALQGSLLTLGILLLAAVLWFIPGSPLSRGPLRRFPDLLERVSTDLHDPFSLLAGFLGYFLSPRLEGTFYSFWGVFGWANILMDGWVYRLLALAVLLAVLGWWRAARSLTSEQKQAGILCAATVATVLFVGIYRELDSTIPVVGRYLLLMLSPLSVLLAAGLAYFLPRLRLHWILGGGMFFLALLVPFLYIQPAYTPPPNLTLSQLDAIPHKVDASFQGKARLLGYALEGDTLRPGDTIQITLYWRAEAPFDRDYSVFVHLVDEQEIIITQRDSYPGSGLRPTTQWVVGDTFADTYRLSLSPTTYTPSQSHLRIGLYDYVTGQRLPILGADNHPVGDYFRLGEITILPAAETPYPNPIELHFGKRIVLVGYQLDRRVAKPGETIFLTLYWQALGPVEKNWTVFTHILGPENSIWRQHDSPPQNGAYPTSLWAVGQIIADVHALTLQPETSPGTYALEIGLYSSETGERLPLLGEGGFVRDNRVLLTPIRVQ